VNFIDECDIQVCLSSSVAPHVTSTSIPVARIKMMTFTIADLQQSVARVQYANFATQVQKAFSVCNIK
jgi:hypothetical protein